MADASLDLQKALIDTMRADPELTALVGQRIYDRPQPGTAKPYVSLGPEDWITLARNCVQGHEGAVQIDVWSIYAGKTEAKRVAAAVYDSLHQQNLTLANAALLSFKHVTTRYFTEADGVTTHAALDFRANTETPI